MPGLKSTLTTTGCAAPEAVTRPWLFLVLNASGALCLLLGTPSVRLLPGLYFCLFGCGLLVLSLLQCLHLQWAEVVVFSVLLSILASMLLGLMLDLYMAGAPRCVSVFPSRIPSIVSGLVWLLLVALAWVRPGYIPSVRPALQALLHLRLGDACLVMSAGLTLVLVVAGALMVRFGLGDLILLLAYCACAIVLFCASVAGSTADSGLLLIVALTSVALVLALPLRCEHLFGTDVHTEFWWFRETYATSYESLRGANTPLSSCLSVSVFPSMLESITRIEAEGLMRFLYPVLFSLCPVALFISWRQVFTTQIALVATSYYVGQEVFLDATCNPRTVTAILFLAGYVLALSSKTLGPRARSGLLGACALGCVVSHYSSSYVWFVVLLAALAWQCLLHLAGRTPGRALRNVLSGSVGVSAVTLFGGTILLVYHYFTGASFAAGVRRVGSVVTHLHELLEADVRGGSFEGLISVGSAANSVPRNVELSLTWLCFGLIAVGLVAACVEWLWRDRIEEDEVDPRRRNLLALAVGAAAVLVLSMVAPRVFAGYSMRRTYAVAMLVLAPYLALGASRVARRLSLSPGLVGGAIAAAYLLCTTAVVYQLCGVPKDVALNASGPEYELYYVTNSEVAACEWLGECSAGSTIVVSDRMGGPRLLSQGHIAADRILQPEEYTVGAGGPSLAYLRRECVRTGSMTTKSREVLSLGEFIGIHADCVFTSTDAEVLYSCHWKSSE